MIPASGFVNNDTIVFVRNTGVMMYNVLLKTYEKMVVNNMVVETLHPTNKIAKLYYKRIPSLYSSRSKGINKKK